MCCVCTTSRHAQLEVPALPPPRLSNGSSSRLSEICRVCLPADPLTTTHDSRGGDMPPQEASGYAQGATGEYLIFMSGVSCLGLFISVEVFEGEVMEAGKEFADNM